VNMGRDLGCLSTLPVFSVHSLCSWAMNTGVILDTNVDNP